LATGSGQSPPVLSPARVLLCDRSDQDRHRNCDRDDRFQLLPEMKQPKALCRVVRAFHPDVRLDSPNCDVIHSAVLACHERLISGAKRRLAGMLPWSANECHARKTNKKPENRALSRDRQQPGASLSGWSLIPTGLVVCDDRRTHDRRWHNCPISATVKRAIRHPRSWAGGGRNSTTQSVAWEWFALLRPQLGPSQKSPVPDRLRAERDGTKDLPKRCHGVPLCAILVPFVHDALFQARRPSVLSPEQRRF
jgi:hypothetical protein